MKSLSIFALAAGLSLASGAGAQIIGGGLPGESGGATVQWGWIDGANGEGDGGIHQSGASTGVHRSGDGRFTTDMELGPIPFVYADMSSGNNGHSFGYAQIDYDFKVVVGSSGDEILASFINAGYGAIGLGINVGGTYDLETDGVARAVAIVDGGYGGVALNAICENGDTDGPCGTHDFSAGAALYLDGYNDAGLFTAHGHITMAVEADFNPYASGHVLAFLDPVITLSPLLGLDPSDYTITLSPGVANATGAQVPTFGAVPEPASWAMMVGGFGLAGAAMRRRRASPLAA